MRHYKKLPTENLSVNPPFMTNPMTGLPDPNTGIAYDYNKISKLYKSLGCPEDVYDPTHLPFDKCKYFLLTSSRSVGKTTNILLWAMCACKIYGCQIIYIRQREAMIEKRYLDSVVGLFSVIRQFGYIDKLTDGKYNDIDYYARVWRYVRRDENNKIVEKSEPIMVCVDIDQAETYKSTLAAPRGDFLVFDEFISRDYKENEFVTFCDLVKTVIRDRLAPIVLCLANTTDIYNPYLREFGVQGVMASLAEGESSIMQTHKGTMIYCERIGAKSKIRPLVNTQYFGFENPLLSSITGGGGWAINPYPHIWRDHERKVIQRHIFLTFQEQTLELELCTSPSLDYHVCVHMVDKIVDEPVTEYVLTDIRKPYQVYAFGTRRPLDKIIWGLFEANKWYFANDDVGSIVDHYHAQG